MLNRIKKVLEIIEHEEDEFIGFTLKKDEVVHLIEALKSQITDEKTKEILKELLIAVETQLTDSWVDCN